MPEALNYPMTHQRIRDLNNPGQPESVNVGPEERALSLVGGAILTGFGMGIGGMRGCLLATLGSAIACRGVTGHCSAYAVANINTARR